MTASNKPIPNKGKDGKCTLCGARHRSERTFRYCKAKHEFQRKIKKLENASKNGTREEWIKDWDLIRGWYWPQLKDAIKERDGGKCVRCGSNGTETTYGEDWTWLRLDVHHIIPRSQGGSDHPKNLMTQCFDCHKETFENIDSRILAGLNLLLPMEDLNQRTLREGW